MQNRYKTSTVLIICGLMLVVLACTCGPLNTVTQIQGTVGAAQATIGPALTEMYQNQPTFDAMSTEIFMTANAAMPGLEATMTSAVGTVVPGVELRQWASGATATSEYQPESWSAMQATGAPNTPACGDTPTAWASGSSGETAVLTLTYSVPVVPSRIEIHQSYAPGSIVKIEVIDEAGATATIYEAQPAPVDQCPYVQIASVTGVTAKVTTVIITVDQSVITNWNEIDAVELIGIP